MKITAVMSPNRGISMYICNHPSKDSSGSAASGWFVRGRRRSALRRRARALQPPTSGRSPESVWEARE